MSIFFVFIYPKIICSGMLVSFLYFRTNAKGKLDLLTKGRRTLTSGVLQFLGLIGYRFARFVSFKLSLCSEIKITTLK